VSTAKEIVDAIKAHADKEGGGYSTWYAGIAAKPRDRLFTDHGVSEQNAWWIHREADSNSTARAAETTLHEAGFDGGPGGGDSSTKSVYAYKKTAKTVE